MLSPSELDAYLAVATKHKVRAIRLSDGTTVEFSPSFATEDPGTLQEDAGPVAGQWKRGPDLTTDSDTEWD